MLARLETTFTTSELRRLIARLSLKPILTASAIWDWSRWRREHQISAARAHRKIRNNMQL
jgi:predicted transposase YbfD/YdcC